MHIYETGFLLAPNLPEEDTEKLIAQLREAISQREGKLVKQERWGKRRLAYRIQKFSEASYFFFHYEGKPDIPLELERRFKQTDAVLRYLTLKRDAKEAQRRKRKKDAAAEPREAQADFAEGREGTPAGTPGRETGEEVK
ncbi:MAG: 30S ribosomal protein S6 [Acidobacteriota bacterium]